MFRRKVTANTTTRTLKNITERIQVLVENAADLTFDNYDTPTKWMAAAGQLMPGKVSTAVVAKLCLAGEHLGLLERLKPTGSGQRWLKIHPAAEALLTDPDYVGMLAHLLAQAPLSADDPMRDVVGTLGFLLACEKAGISSVRLDHLAYFRASQSKETGWSKQVAALKSHIADNPDAPISPEQWLALADPNGFSQHGMKDAVDALARKNPANEAEVQQFVLEAKSDLLPSVRDTTRITKALAEHILSGDLEAAKKALIAAAVTEKAYNHMDLVNTHFQYMLDTEMIVLANPENSDLGARQFVISPFGREVLESAPPRPASYAIAKREQRASTSTPFKERNKKKSERFDAFLSNDRTEAGRTALYDALDWGQYSGKHEAHGFEWAVVRAIIALTSVHHDHDRLKGVRTPLSHDFEARYHAPGGGADGWVRTAAGRTILIEATGEAGRKLIAHELEPVVRHLESVIQDGAVDTVSLLVAPSFESRLVSYVLVDAQDREDSPSACVLPITTTQLQRLLQNGALIDDLIYEATVLLKTASNAPGQAAASKFMEDLEALIAVHLEN